MINAVQHNRTKKGDEAIRSLVLGNCDLGSLSKGPVRNLTHDPSTVQGWIHHIQIYEQ